MDIIEGQRLTKYDTHVKPNLERIYQWLKDGVTEYSICDQLNIDVNTWISYKKQYSDISDLYTRATLERNSLVMNSMFKKSVGHVAPVKKQVIDKFGEIHTLETEIYTPPDVNAADLYLRNNMQGYVQPRGTGEGSLTVTVQLPGLKQELDKLTGTREKLERELLDIELGKDDYEIEPEVAKQEGKPLKAGETERPEHTEEEGNELF